MGSSGLPILQHLERTGRHPKSKEMPLTPPWPVRRAPKPWAPEEDGTSSQEATAAAYSHLLRAAAEEVAEAGGWLSWEPQALAAKNRFLALRQRAVAAGGLRAARHRCKTAAW